MRCLWACKYVQDNIHYKNFPYKMENTRVHSLVKCMSILSNHLKIALPISRIQFYPSVYECMMKENLYFAYKHRLAPRSNHISTIMIKSKKAWVWATVSYQNVFHSKDYDLSPLSPFGQAGMELTEVKAKQRSIQLFGQSWSISQWENHLFNQLLYL